MGTETREFNKDNRFREQRSPGPAAYDSLDSFKSTIKKRVPTFQYVADHFSASNSFATKPTYTPEDVTSSINLIRKYSK